MNCRLYLSVHVFSTKVLIEDTICMSYTGDASTLALERHGKLARGFQWRGSFDGWW